MKYNNRNPKIAEFCASEDGIQYFPKTEAQEGGSFFGYFLSDPSRKKVKIVYPGDGSKRNGYRSKGKKVQSKGG